MSLYSYFIKACHSLVEDLSEGNRLLDLYIFYVINDVMVMRRSNRTYHIPRAYPGHLTIFRAQRVGNLTGKAFLVVRI